MKRITKIGMWGITLMMLSACGNGTPDYDATGTFEATEVIVSAEAAGKLLRLEVEEGTKLEAGEEIGLVDTVQLYLKKLQLEASMKSVENQRPDLAKQIAATKQQIVTAERERKRVENLLAAGAANQKQLDDWDAQVKLLERQLVAQESSLRNSTNSLTEQGNSVAIQVAQVEDQLAKCHVQSPIAGTVLAKYAETGELAAIGKPLFKVGEVDRMYLRAYITSEQLSQVKLGDQVTVYADYGNSEQKAYPGEVTWISEDWDSIAALVKQSDMMFREATLDLIGNVDIDKGRERMLMHLADGKPYKYLAEKIFPEVMRVDYRIEYTRQPLDAAESLRLFRTGERRALRLNEFFTVAGSYPQGSTEYNDVLDLAARLFPDSPEANINAAAVALTKGETAKARRYLERFATLPMAYNNMGILCLQEGNRDKAEVYLTMAAAAGVKQADKALKELKR